MYECVCICMYIVYIWFASVHSPQNFLYSYVIVWSYKTYCLLEIKNLNLNISLNGFNVHAYRRTKRVKYGRLMGFCWNFRESSINNEWMSLWVNGVYILLSRPTDTLDLWFVEHCIKLLNVFDLEQRCDKNDQYPACHWARITYLVIVGVHFWP